MSRKRQKPAARTTRLKQPRPSASRTGGRLTTLVLAAALVAAGAWAYWTSFPGVLVLDDVRAIQRNQTIRTLWPLSTPLAPPTASTVAGRPIANLSFAVNYALAPPDAREVFDAAGVGPQSGSTEEFLRNIWGYHFANLFIHLAAGLTLFGIVRRTLSSERLRGTFGNAASWLACVVALLWLVHPLQTASVTYLVQRVESLMGLFYLLTLYCAIRASHGQRASAWMAGAIACCALGMATKEVMVTAPVMVWLWQRTFATEDRRGRWPVLAGLAATWLILAFLVLHEHRAPSIDLGTGMVWRYLITQAAVILHYIRLVFVPVPLVFLYDWPIAPSLGGVFAQVVLVGLLIGLTVFAIARRHPLGFVGAWFFLILAPTSSVLPIVTEVATEQRMYLPLAAIVACTVSGAFVAGRRFVRTDARRLVAASAVITLALVALCGSETRARNADYWSETDLWRKTVEAQPQNERARVAYGVALSRQRRFADAEVELQAAVELNPVDALAHGRLGAAQAAQGKLDLAVVHLERAVALAPADVDAHRWLGQAYAMRRNDALAVAHFTRVLEAGHEDPALLVEVAGILADSRDPAVRDGSRAVALAERAAALTSRSDPRALDVLAVAQAAVGRFREAAATAAEGLRLVQARGNSAAVAEFERRVQAYSAMAGVPNR